MLEDEFMNFRMKNYTRCLAYGNSMLIPWFFGYVSQFYWILGSIIYKCGITGDQGKNDS